jgi:hypothetical protein
VDAAFAPCKVPVEAAFVESGEREQRCESNEREQCLAPEHGADEDDQAQRKAGMQPFLDARHVARFLMQPSIECG